MDWRTRCLILIAIMPFSNTRQEDALTFLDKSAHSTSTLKNGEDVTTIPSLTIDEEVALATRINDFGLQLINKMIELGGTDKNIVISPTSISGLLGMVLLGTVGVTFDEIVKVIGFSSDVITNQRHHKEFGNLLDALNSEGETKTAYANAIFVDEQTKLRSLYRNFTERVYHGSVTNLDFKKTKESQDYINQWVAEHTRDKIVNFLQRPLPVDTRVVLLSALYFSGQWEKPFTPEFTKNMTFHKQDGTTVEAELMLNYGKFKYAYSTELESQLVAIPYRGGDTVLYVIKPRKHNKPLLQDVLLKLNADKLDKFIEKATNRTCVIRFPKMKLTQRSDLKDTLKSLGMDDVFTSKANFGLMVDVGNVQDKSDDVLAVRIGEDVDQLRSGSYWEALSKLPNPGVHVDSIIHQVEMNINEFGTEASAITSGILTRTAELILTDSPFFFFIRNENTKLITFSSAIFNPTL